LHPASAKIDLAPDPAASCIFPMTQQNPLDQKGNFEKYPLAELFVEIGQAKLSGSLRISRAEQKSVIYFDEGKVVFAVSNSRALRLFNVMLLNKKIAKSALTAHSNFTNDLEFSASLQKIGGFSKAEVDAIFALQIDAIIVDALAWPDGDWHFSPLARLRGDMRFNSNVQGVLIDYARCVRNDILQERMGNVKEGFTLSPHGVNGHPLQAHESYVLERFSGRTLTIEQLREMNSLPESGMLQALYVLWLGGLLIRRDWNAAFSPVKIGEILSTRLVKVRAAEYIETPEASPEKEPEPEPVAAVMKAAEITMSLEEYLKRVESAETHYDIFGLSLDAELIEIKQTYFGLAKLFHPDKFHRETGKKLRRIQTAYTDLAHAYETLKDPESREAYNFKMRKEIEAREKRIRDGEPDDARADKKRDSALQSFEQALVFLKKEDYEQAVVLLGRAVHYSPENAQFHAYYGKALSAFEGQDHKAEAEFQMAVKLAPKDVKIRMMLVDFLVEIEMLKRAVGELNRFLSLVPGNQEAVHRLEKLQK
jgi:tetratricopeptide (TPR) repeat protein